MTKVLAIASQKGGVGKTTTAINLGSYLAQSGREVLIIDLDPQGNATSGLSVVSPSSIPITDLWAGKSSWEDLSASTTVPQLSVFGAGPRAETLDDLSLRSTRVSELRASLATSPWEIVVIDSPPSLGPATHLALSWADEVLIPVQCEYFAMEGLTQMLELVERTNRERSKPLEIAGILLTLFSETSQLSVEVVEEVRKYFPRHVLETIIPRDEALAEATSHGEPVSRYAPRARGAWAYLNLAKEILAHEREEAR